MPGSAHDLSRDDHLHPLLEPDVTARDQQNPRAKAQGKYQGKYQTQDQAAREPTLHSPNLSQDARIPDRRIRSPCDQIPEDSVVLLQPDDSSAIRALTRLATRLNHAGQIVATRPIQATPTGWSGEFGELVNSSGPRPRLRNLREMNVLTTIRPSQPQVESGPSRRFEGRSFPGRLSPRTTPSRSQA